MKHQSFRPQATAGGQRWPRETAGSRAGPAFRPLPTCGAAARSCVIAVFLSLSPVTGMSPLSPYLSLDPKYLVQDTDEFILPTGANKTRGRFELAFFTIGGCCMTGAAFGALNGLRLGLKETQNMAWSKPRNVQILNMVTRQGALWANTLGSLALLYSAFGVIIEKTRGAEDDLNTIAAGTLTGMLYKSTGGVRGIARGGIAGLTLTGLYALYNNWEHMKGSIARQSL
ncbi:mitochondrial import inner membrane translocase subunit Tim23 [Meleagris gallopavo]|uniref:mitochondrial import inner membrane translocase subunit Tim23 n=1 Tax=Meleagris gallopavo TaxID=9103 RepID=UPI00093982A9|nr:mitochondrial import inner membrane translocase subunit Tim23 [Meleagris gallopavo]